MYLLIVLHLYIPRMSNVEIDICKTEIEEMLKLGVIEPSNSEWQSVVVMVPKPDNTIGFCVNVCHLALLLHEKLFKS